MFAIASAHTKHLAAVLLIGAVALISPSIALAHAGGGSSGGASSSSGSHSGGHSTVSSSRHSTTAVSQGKTHTTSSSKNRKRWLFFGHVMHADCLGQLASTTPTHDTGGEVSKKKTP
jgi:hypothetical protein